MVNRILKAEMMHGAQAKDRVCLVLHAEDENDGGFIMRLPVSIRS